MRYKGSAPFQAFLQLRQGGRGIGRQKLKKGAEGNVQQMEKGGGGRGSMTIQSRLPG